MKEKLIKGVSIGLCIGVALGVGAWQLADNWDKIFPDKNIEQENPSIKPKPDESLIVQAKFKVNGVTIATRSVATGGLLEDLPEAPEQDGYKFVGWRVLDSGDGTTIDFTTYQFADNVVFVPVFELLDIARCWINDDEYVDIVNPTNEKLASANLPTEVDGKPVLGWGLEGSCGRVYDSSVDIVSGCCNIYPIFACDFEGEFASDDVVYTGTATELRLTPESAIEQGGRTYLTLCSVPVGMFKNSSVTKLTISGFNSISYRALAESNISMLIIKGSDIVSLDIYPDPEAEPEEVTDQGITLYVEESLVDLYREDLYSTWGTLTGNRIYAIEEA